MSVSSSLATGDVIATEPVPVIAVATATTTAPIVEATIAAGNATSSNATTNDGTYSVAGTILVIARDSASASVASSGLNGYGIPFETLLVPSAGVTLPTLNTSTTAGNYGGIVVASQVSYDYGTAGYASALTTDQWNQLYAYQLSFGVRMVQFDVYPGPAFGATALGGCCATGVEQLISFSNTANFTQAGLKVGATMSTSGLYHYPATVSDSSTTVEIAQFAANSDFSSVSTAAVINNFAGREQMAFFISWATDWSPTSNFLQHAWITWMTRGLFAGYRRTYLNTQIDDMMLNTDIYSPNGTSFRVRAADMTNVKSWITTINAKMNSGSSYWPEVGFNGNGNIEAAEDTTTGATACGNGAIEYDEIPDTALEFQKPLGSGSDFWPTTPTAYDWTTTCLNLDSLKVWWATTANRDAFGVISHTFTHEELNNATYADATKEISFNQAWFTQSAIGGGAHWTSDGLIPPAITGLHNGDALRAWADNGLKHAVGDNTRPVLMNTDNYMWPLYTTVAANGYAGIEIIPRWATRIYYNCDTPACTLAEWIATSAGSGDFDSLLAQEKADTTRHLMGLRHDPYMFHQANLRNTDIDAITINGVSSKISIFQAWVETVVQEFVRLANWPLITIKQGDIATDFANRMTRDACGYKLTYKQDGTQITGVTVSSSTNTCSVPVPVTFPGTVTSTQGFTTEQIGNDPLTIWVQLSGSPVSFTLTTPVTVA